MKCWRSLTIVFVALAAHEVLATGMPLESEGTITAALNWLMRHQDGEGSWSMDYSTKCIDATCTDRGKTQSKTAATALGLLPFLGANVTPERKSPWQRTANDGLLSLIKVQANDGNLAPDGDRPMSAHGLAAVCLCEAYNMTQEPRFKRHVAAAAQAAVNFLAQRQNKDGGWSEKPGEASDLLVVGWQMLAIKSAQLAGLVVDPAVIDGMNQYLQGLAQGQHGGLFAGAPKGNVSPIATAIGLLGLQYFGADGDDLALSEGRAYLMANLPSDERRDAVYWFFATQVMHVPLSPDWDKWNRPTSRLLRNSQSADQCAAGSWGPEKLVRGSWGGDGGRLVATSLSTLTLEVPYRNLLLFKLDQPAAAK